MTAELGAAPPNAERPQAPILRMTGIIKRYPGTLAVDDVDLEVVGGTIHGLLGENGAGKSTLLRILAGDQAPTAGSIELDGQRVDITSPAHAHSLGIGIVYQELSLLPNLSVGANISLGGEPMRGLAIDDAAIRATAEEALGRIGVTSISPHRLVASLSLAERQLVEIAKVLTLQRPRILIFDEPTAALNRHDVVRLFAIMRGLRAEGVALLFVSHRYREVLDICDVATVLRNGRVVGTVQRGEATLERLIELTLGQRAEATFRREWHSDRTGEPVLTVRGLRVGSRVAGVDLQLRRGEILGVCGLLGSGQNELARAIGGDADEVTGEVTLLGRAGRARTPRAAVSAGVGLITEKRQDEGLFPNLSVAPQRQRRSPRPPRLVSRRSRDPDSAGAPARRGRDVANRDRATRAQPCGPDPQRWQPAEDDPRPLAACAGVASSSASSRPGASTWVPRRRSTASSRPWRATARGSSSSRLTCRRSSASPIA